jgi:uncharacterized membrane protein
MKIVKIIVIFLVVLSFIFFGTGLVIKENNYSVEISINKPLEETFQLFNNQELMTQWVPQVTKVETIKENPGIIGSEYRITIDNNGETITMKEKVLAFVENQKVTQYFDQENVLKTNDYVFATEGSQTKIVLNATYQAESYILNCVFPYFKGTFKGVDQTNLDNFKTFAEKQ